MICARCTIDKPETEFPVDGRRAGGRYSYCKPCKSEYMREYRSRQHPESVKAKQRSDNLRRYGITPDQFDEMMTRQNGQCAICGTTDPGRNHGRMVVDHDHATGKVRGLLCGACNTGIGMFSDDVLRLAAAIEYLNSTPKEPDHERLL